MSTKTTYTAARTPANNTLGVSVKGLSLSRKVRTSTTAARERIEQLITVDFDGASLEGVIAYAASQMIITKQADWRVSKDAPEREHLDREAWLHTNSKHTILATAILAGARQEVTEDELIAQAAKFGYTLVKAPVVE